ncbi:MAG: hypothetical protein AB1342_07390 [Pseudomonadota bacterium]
MFGITRFLAGAISLFIFAGNAQAAGCNEPDAGSDKAAMFSPPLGEVVTGAGRLQFYSAPDMACAMQGVFIIPKDQVIAYADTDDGWTSVMYTNPRTNNVVQGWVRSARLKSTGTVGPRQ